MPNQRRCQSIHDEHNTTHNTTLGKIADLVQNMKTKAQRNYVHQTREDDISVTNTQDHGQDKRT